MFSIHPLYPTSTHLYAVSEHNLLFPWNQFSNIADVDSGQRLVYLSKKCLEKKYNKEEVSKSSLICLRCFQITLVSEKRFMGQRHAFLGHPINDEKKLCGPLSLCHWYLFQFGFNGRLKLVKEGFPQGINDKNKFCGPLSSCQQYLFQFGFDGRLKLVKEGFAQGIDDSIDDIAQISAAQQVFEIHKNAAKTKAQIEVIRLTAKKKKEEINLVLYYEWTSNRTRSRTIPIND